MKLSDKGDSVSHIFREGCQGFFASLTTNTVFAIAWFNLRKNAMLVYQTFCQLMQVQQEYVFELIMSLLRFDGLQRKLSDETFHFLFMQK